MRAGVWLMATGSLCISYAQPPAIGQNGAMNAASRISTTLPGGEIARGARFLLQGVRLNKAVRLTLRGSGQTRDVAIQSASFGELDAWMPYDAPVGDAELIVESQDGSAKPFSIEIVTSRPGLYSVNRLGLGPARSYGPRNPAGPGDLVTIASTGLGDAKAIELMVGGRRQRNVTITRNVEPGIDSLRFPIPLNVVEGCYVPVYARGPSGISNVVTLSIASQGSVCRPTLASGPPASASRQGVLGVFRTMALLTEGQSPITEDQAYGGFYSIDPTAWEVSPGTMLPPAGQCTAATGDSHRDLDTISLLPLLPKGGSHGTQPDAGAGFTIRSESATRHLGRASAPEGMYWNLAGTDNPQLPRAPALFLQNTPLTISSLGGPDVEAFSRELPALSTLVWTNRDQFVSIPLGQSVTFIWKGAARDAVVVVGAFSVDQVSAAGAIVLCSARPEAGRLTVPAELFAHFPPTGQMPGPLRGGTMVISIRVRDGMRPAIRGLDSLHLVSAYSSSRRSDFK